MLNNRNLFSAPDYLTLKSLLLMVLVLSCFPLAAYAEKDDDPLESFNRAVFWFNDTVDVYVLEPVAKGYKAILPNFAQKGISNFFSHLNYPSYLVSDLVQLKLRQAVKHSGRFVINSTFGLAGFIDVAANCGLENHYEDFGVSLGYHGVPEGPYLVLPFLGPSNVRDALGRAVDAFLDPTYYVNYTSASTTTKYAISTGLTTLDVISTRARLLEAVTSAKESSLDYYLFVRSAYHQVREGDIFDGKLPEEEDFLDNIEDEYE